MLQNCIRAENRKLHASPIWIMFFLLPVISAGYGTFNYLQNLEILTDGWYSLWTQHTLFYSMFFFPAMVAAYAAYLWRLEHLGHNWNFIMAAPVHPLALFLLRGALGALAVIAAQLVLAMVIRSFAVPIFLGLLGGITGIFAAAKGFGLLWPYALMQAGMNANRSTDMLAGQYALFFFSCVLWLAAMFALAYLLLQKRDVKA